jgi:hypothetical protein
LLVAAATVGNALPTNGSRPTPVGAAVPRKESLVDVVPAGEVAAGTAMWWKWAGSDAGAEEASSAVDGSRLSVCRECEGPVVVDDEDDEDDEEGAEVGSGLGWWVAGEAMSGEAEPASGRASVACGASVVGPEPLLDDESALGAVSAPPAT